MKIDEAKKTFQDLFSGHNIDFSFDNDCIRSIEFSFHDGKILQDAHIAYDKLKITIDNDMVKYVPINPHREIKPHQELKDKICDICSI